ncbi:MAG: tyrosine--tRNA ligase [Alphaproteobacteria bacterium]|nr:tyrosine--tRNA ligase [Alphaproteobacteria bacterium]
MTSVSKHRSELIDVLIRRGFLHQCTDIDKLDEFAAANIVTAYNGFDATADSLHVGHLLPIMMLRWIQKTGHRPIALIGGGTTKVGDPSGKEETRQLLDDDAINTNIASIRKTFEKLITFGNGKTDALLVNNADWLDSLQYIPFLRDVGQHFTINRMLTMDSVRLRLDREQPLTFLEFNYMILQSYDFLELHKRYGCNLQTGGSDQWGNIVNGIELGRRVAKAELFGLTCPLITTSSGAKMGKTASGAVWLNEERLSAYDYYQYWRNTEDPDVGRFLRLFTELPMNEVERLETLRGGEVNEAKKILAFETTKLLHGEPAAIAAQKTAELTFESGGTGDNLPHINVSEANLSRGVSLVDALKSTKLCKSGGEARRLIAGGGAKVNGQKIEDEAYMLQINDFVNGELKLSSGKKRHAVVSLT